MKKLRRILVLALCLTMIVGIAAACADPTPDAPAPAPAPAPEPPAPAPPPAPPPGENRVELTFSFWGDITELDTTQEALNDFNNVQDRIWVTAVHLGSQ